MHDRTLMESLFCKHTWGIVCLVCDQGVHLTPSPPRALCLPCDRYRQIQAEASITVPADFADVFSSLPLGMKYLFARRVHKKLHQTSTKKFEFKESCRLACPRRQVTNANKVFHLPPWSSLALSTDHSNTLIESVIKKNVSINTSYWLISGRMSITCVGSTFLHQKTGMKKSVWPLVLLSL